ncbi:MAG: TVP38/TMEM64 family protein [Nitrospirota bacterium]
MQPVEAGWIPGRTHRRLAGLGMIVLGVVGFVWLWQGFDLSDLLTTERLVGLFQSAGPFGPLILMFSMATAVVVSPIPSLPIDLAAGAAYGPAWGATYAVIGAEIGAVVSFLISRALGRAWLYQLLRLDIRFCEKCSDRHLVTVLVLARLLPIVSFDVVSYGAGLTNMSVMTFALATLIGMAPPTFAFTYFGSSVVSARWTLILTGGLVVAALLLAPKLVLRHPHAWWARLFLAAAPGSPEATASQRTQTTAAESLRPNCSGCGGPLTS